ncbi:hypothetical protein HYR69_03375 [Candidatus Sumerlaeota bacterium]|nr:hypothetical protein [Candidatus Sumerlaeota bacterium]
MRSKFRFILGALLCVGAMAGRAWASHPLDPIFLTQEAYDDSIILTGGSTLPGDPFTVKLTASSQAATCGGCDYNLELEIQPLGVPFTGIPNYSSILNGKSCVDTQYPFIVITGLAPNTAYHWQVRETTCTGGGGAGPTSGKGGDIEPNGGGGSSSWVPYNWGGVAFITGLTANPNFEIMGYYPSTDQGKGEFFFIDKNAYLNIRSYLLEVRRVDNSTIWVLAGIFTLPGGPGPGDVVRHIKFTLPLVDVGTPTSFEIDMQYRLNAYTGPDGTGTLVYRTPFSYAAHPSTDLQTPVFSAPPVAVGIEPLQFTDNRPTAQRYAYNYEIQEKIVNGPQTLVGNDTHGIDGSFQTKSVHPPVTRTRNVPVLDVPSQIYFVRSRKNYFNNGALLIGRFDIAHKSPNLLLDLPPGP